jgi:hypothetical protein
MSKILRCFVRLPLGWLLKAPSAVLGELPHDQRCAVMVHEKDPDVSEYLSRLQPEPEMMAEIESLESSACSHILGLRQKSKTMDFVCQPEAGSAIHSTARDIGLAFDCDQCRPEWWRTFCGSQEVVWLLQVRLLLAPG